MRFKKTNGTFRLYAVTGTNTIAFAIDCKEDAMTNLLGFTIEKQYKDPDNKDVRVTVMGFKVFKERIENPVPGALYSTYDNPIQSFTWEDFSAYPDREYTYHFTPLYDNPLNIRRGKTYSIEVKTEPAWMDNQHSVFFNRGVASSQAYAVKFGNKNPDDVPDGKAYDWLSRGLKEAIITFIGKAQKDDHLYGCFYEFRNDEILTKFREAAERGVKIEIIFDAKDNGHTDNKTGKWVDSFPKKENEDAIKRAQLDTNPNITLIPRQRNKSYLCHNKFMVLVKDKPTMVWTGSTNLSKGGIFGQTNVGHALEDEKAATDYLTYWNKLKDDPDSKTIKDADELIHKDIMAVSKIPAGLTCILSPRKKDDILKLYATLLDSAKDCACITLAFGVHKYFEEALSDNTTANALTFLLLEKDDPDISDYIYKNNIVKAVGSYIQDNSVYKWVKETNTAALGLNTHVMYVHTKFMLVDPLGGEPVIVTGSANFSEAATETNDENMIILKGKEYKRVADIYFTEFMRIFNHYYFRWIVRKMLEKGVTDLENPAFLTSDYKKWTDQYRHGKYKRRRIDIFKDMII
jgi:phosphatidylserine/phosphatidylglycerophosphate/cardiolipin synthase-like enzyme